MKIGVITIVLNENYGGILQAYALQKILKDMGHEVTLIDRYRGYYMSFGDRCKSYSKRFIQRYLQGKDIPVRYDKSIQDEIKAISKYTRPFIDKHINRIITRDFKNIKADDFDTFIVGSDQIWRAPASRPQLYNVYLDFAKEWDVNRISYAASFGTNEWEYSEEETAICGTLLRRFDTVSVRERSGVDLCKTKFNVDATFVLDPTMLLNKEDYNSLLGDKRTTNREGKLFCYILDENKEKDELIKTVAKETNYKPFFINSKYQDKTAPIEDRVQPPVEEWLRGFNDAGFVITDSFHACVFSIIYNKPFIVYKNESRGNARFDSLLETFGLKNRSYDKEYGLSHLLDDKINWDKINQTLSTLKEFSFNFLKTSLQTK